MILLSNNQNPINSIIYISGCIYGELKNQTQYDLSQLFYLIKERYNRNISINRFILAINFLYLCGLIYLEGHMLSKN